MTPQTDVLDKMLTHLKLTAIREELESLMDEAGRRQMSLSELLGFLCEAEIARKDQRRITMGLSIAKFPCLRTLEGFHFKAQPSMDVRQIQDLAACRWVAKGDSFLFLGPPGVDKTHLAIARGRTAIERGYSVLVTPAIVMAASLAKAHAKDIWRKG